MRHITLDLFSLCSLEYCYCREDVHAIVYPTLAIAGPGAKKAAPPIVPVATAKPPPPVPPRVVGSKRKFVDDQRPRYNSINPARKVAKLP